ncbi:MAG: protein kinase domain-containing protein [Candidatus Acidiferrales bacterium]
MTDPPKPGERQDTLLLTDVPDATALLREASAAISAPFAPVSFPHLGSAALAALGQRYDILAEAGHGSMGNVYKARDRETGEIVALKLLKQEIASDQAMMDRFKNELLFARKITHKNVCRVYDFNRLGGIACTSMEFVEGESLRSVFTRFGGLPLRKSVHLALQICSGLKEAHAQGIVHRDLKPENVMIDAQGNVKIMDFGIARSMEAGTRSTGSLAGTPAYMAPEQVAGKPVDYRTDIYSLGLILYEMFTGAQAFHAETAVAVALKQLREDPAPPHEIEPAIPVPIERAILKCLEKEPVRRFQSIAELENDLRASGVPGISAVAGAHNSSRLTPLPGVGLAPVPQFHATPHPALGSSPMFSAVAHPLTFAPPKRESSPLAWALFGAFLVLVALGGMRWVATARAADMIPPPQAMSPPAPPAFALDSTVEPPANAAAPADSTQQPAADSNAAAAQPAPLAANAPAGVAPPVITPAKITPAANAPVKAVEHARKSAPADSSPSVRADASRAFHEGGTAADSSASILLWVGRFEREDRAQAAAKKIEDLGLPVLVRPRDGPKGQFFVVFAGPFSQKNVPSVSQWLETQGFSNVRPVAIPEQK